MFNYKILAAHQSTYLYNTLVPYLLVVCTVLTKQLLQMPYMNTVNTGFGQHSFSCCWTKI